MPPLHHPDIFHRPRKQQGAALLIMLVIMVVGAATMLVGSPISSGLRIERDKITADALAQAKDALIGYAVRLDELSKSTANNQARPGDLPCPDRNDNGEADDGACGNAAGSNPASRLGRLPWKTLGIPDLRDSSGERLWYAVSNNFKHNIRTDTLNSDTPGTITVRNQDGSILHDASTQNGVVAVLFAPGAVLMRTDQAAPQDRSIAGVNNALNYLDIANGEDNAEFADSMQNGFIQGSIKDVNGNILLNDQLLAITQDDLMRPVQKRVAGEVKQCLIEFSATSNQRYPWAVPLNDLIDYKDADNNLFGRIPDDLNKTQGSGMQNKWGNQCNTHDNNTASTWWKNWRELVFYAVAKDYEPHNNGPDVITCEAANHCLSVTPPPAALGNKKFVVIVAGKKLTWQSRTPGANQESPINYLEAPNSDGDTVFGTGTPSANFNDTVVFE